MTMTVDAPAKMSTRQRLTIFLLLGTGFMLSVDFSIMNVALPQLGAGVGLRSSELPWVVSAYALPAAGFTLLFGRIADLFGRRRMFVTGVGLLTASSLVGGFATNPALLLTARTLQGFATAIAAPAALSLLITSFRDERQRARVLGLNGTLLSSGFTVGALVGGTLVGLLNWRWAFLINVPVAVLILAATPFLVPAGRAPSRVRLDVPGAVTVTAGLLAFTFGVVNRNWAALAAGVVLLVVFVLIERRSAAPLAAVGILSRPSVKWGNIAGLVIFTMEPGLIFLMTLYLQEVLRFAPLTTGLIFGVPGLASVAAGVIAGRVIARAGVRKVLAAGMAVQVGFTVPLLALGPHRVWLAVLLPALFLGFFGHVTSIVSYMVTATSGLPDSEQGLATGLATLTQQVGLTIGAPILFAIVATRAVLLTGIHLALAIDVTITVIALALIWIGLRPRPQDPQATGEASEAAEPDIDERETDEREPVSSRG
jgi:MFS family permease